MKLFPFSQESMNTLCYKASCTKSPNRKRDEANTKLFPFSLVSVNTFCPKASCTKSLNRKKEEKELKLFPFSQGSVNILYPKASSTKSLNGEGALNNPTEYRATILWAKTKLMNYQEKEGERGHFRPLPYSSFSFSPPLPSYIFLLTPCFPRSYHVMTRLTLLIKCIFLLLWKKMALLGDDCNGREVRK